MGDSCLCRLSLLLLLQLPTWASTGQFRVIGPSEPIVAVLGGDAMLPCYVFPATNVRNMELRWFRTTLEESVFVYRNQRERKDEQMAEYAGRASVDFLAHGEAAVSIHDIRVSDSGTYTCFFKTGSFFEEANLELKVAGVGSAPQVYIQGPEEDGVRVVCAASGWFPKPQVQWRDVSGKKILAFSEAHTQDAEELFSVEATLVVRDSSVGNVTCSILNPILGQERAVAIFIPEHSAKLQILQERKQKRLEKEEDKKTKEQALKEKDELQAELGQRKAAYLAAWRKAQLYADWRKEQFQARSVILDPGSAHASIDLSPGKTSLTWKDSSGSEIWSVLGLEGITSGRWYWEVRITNEDHSEWTVGVCREDVERTGWYIESLGKGFWVVRWGKHGYFTDGKCDTGFPVKQECCRVGVFLDYSEGDVSFYDMAEGSHIFSLPQASFSGTLFPYFSFKSGCGSLELPASLNNSSLEETLRPSGKGLISGSAVDDVAPGADFPLLSGSPEL